MVRIEKGTKGNIFKLVKKGNSNENLLPADIGNLLLTTFVKCCAKPVIWADLSQSPLNRLSLSCVYSKICIMVNTANLRGEWQWIAQFWLAKILVPKNSSKSLNNFSTTVMSIFLMYLLQERSRCFETKLLDDPELGRRTSPHLADVSYVQLGKHQPSGEDIPFILRNTIELDQMFRDLLLREPIFSLT